MRKRIYVGLSGSRREIFRSEAKPTEKDWPMYSAVIGPFKTMSGARVSVEAGYGNPHTCTVADCERIARSRRI